MMNIYFINQTHTREVEVVDPGNVVSTPSSGTYGMCDLEPVT